MHKTLCHHVAAVLSEEWPIPSEGRAMPALETAVQVVAVLLTEAAEAREIVQYLAWVEKHHLERVPDQRRLDATAAELLALRPENQEATAQAPRAGAGLPQWVARTIGFAGGLAAWRG